MKHAIGPRREMGVRTVFNVLGPLTNPAGAPHQLLGVYDRALVEPIAMVLCELGSDAACVVHSADGLDELSISDVNYVARLRDAEVFLYEVDGQDYGLERTPLEAVRGGDVRENADTVRKILAGARGPKRDMVLLNAGAALEVAGLAHDIQEGMGIAAEAIDTGRGMGVLEALIAFTGAST
jgi:anthranilate phosphoribosyltransferase